MKLSAIICLLSATTAFDEMDYIPHESLCSDYETDPHVFCELETDCCGRLTLADQDEMLLCYDKTATEWLDFSDVHWDFECLETKVHSHPHETDEDGN